MQPGTLRAPFHSQTRSVREGIPTQSVGTISAKVFRSRSALPPLHAPCSRTASPGSSV